jgi:hypothetical protein
MREIDLLTSQMLKEKNQHKIMRTITKVNYSINRCYSNDALVGNEVLCCNNSGLHINIWRCSLKTLSGKVHGFIQARRDNLTIHRRCCGVLLTRHVPRCKVLSLACQNLVKLRRFAYAVDGVVQLVINSEGWCLLHPTLSSLIYSLY